MQITEELLKAELEGLKRQKEAAQDRVVQLSGAIAAVSALLQHAMKNEEVAALSEQELAEAVAGTGAVVETIEEKADAKQS